MSGKGGAKKFVYMLMEHGQYSLTRVLPVTVSAVYLLCAIYGTLTGKAWAGFGDFTSVEVVCIVAVLGNKIGYLKYDKLGMGDKDGTATQRGTSAFAKGQAI